MATIIFADKTLRYDGRDLESRPLGGTESSVIQCARELAKRGHQVSVYSNCDAPVMDQGVMWRPLDGERPDACDLYIACHQPELLGFVRRPRRAAIWGCGRSTSSSTTKNSGGCGCIVRCRC